MKFWITRIISIIAGIGFAFLLEAVSHHLPGGDYTTRLVALVGLYVTLAVSLNLINGIAGQFSVGHAAFYQVGAYLSAYASVHFYGRFGLTGVPWLLAVMLLGAVCAGIAGLVVGLPSLRLRGDYLAIVTMGFGEIIRIIVQNLDALGGSYGMNVTPKFQLVWPVWILALLCIAVCRNLLKTAHGLPFLAVREDEVAASAMGVNVTGVKVIAFVIGSMFAGAAGALLAHFEGFITPATFAMDTSFIILTMVVLGGTGSITGSVVAAVLLSYLPEFLRGLKGADGGPLMVSGASVVAAMVALALAVGFTKRMLEHYHKPNRSAVIAGIIVASVVAKIPIQLILNHIGKLGTSEVQAGQLRMVIFAITLIVLMLLRPQGMFGHHEYSTDWLKQRLGFKPQEAQA